MRASRVGVVFLFCIAASYASASEIETLFPDGGLRYKSCQINLASKTDGYAVNIKRDCPSGYCYNHQMKGSVEVNAKQIEVFGKTLTNHHKIDRNSKTIAFEVKEYGEWHEGTGIGASIFGTNESVLVGHYYTKLEMRIDKTTGQVVKFKAYRKGSVNWGAAARGGILTTLRGLHAIGKKRTLVDCESPGQEMHRTLISLLEVVAYKKTLSHEERVALDAKLLEHLSVAKEEDYLEVMFSNTPLHYAAKYGLEKFARSLIPLLPQEAENRDNYRRGNPINFQNSHGETPLHLAVERGHVEVVKILLATKGIDTSITNYRHYDREETAKQVAVANVTKYCEADAASQDCRDAQEIAALFGQS